MVVCVRLCECLCVCVCMCVGLFICVCAFLFVVQRAIPDALGDTVCNGTHGGPFCK